MLTEKGKLGPHTSPISGHSPLRDIGCLLALVGWQGSPLDAAFQSLWGTEKPQSRAQISLCTCFCTSPSFYIHTEKHTIRISKVKGEMCVYYNNRWARILRVLTLSWISWTSSKTIAYGERFFMISKEEDSGTRDQSWSRESFCM